MTWIDLSEVAEETAHGEFFFTKPGYCGLCNRGIYLQSWNNCYHVVIRVHWGRNTRHVLVFADSLTISESKWVLNPSAGFEMATGMGAMAAWLAFMGQFEDERCFECGQTEDVLTLALTGYSQQQPVTYRACVPCAQQSDLVERCDNCEQFTDSGQCRYINGPGGFGGEICDTCIRSLEWSQCSHCSDWIGPEDDCCALDEDGAVPGCGCYTCRRARSNRPQVINSYSYRPALDFKTVGGDIKYGVGRHGAPVDRTPYMGFELEVEVDRVRDREEVAREFQKAMGKAFYLKADGSIGHGFEIVSHPMTLEYAMEKVNWRAIREFRKDGRIYSADNCGMHVHVSRSAFTNRSHVLRWMLLFHRNRLAMQAIAGRESSYARFDSANRAYTVPVVKGEQHHRETERYSAINMINDNTYEVRIFESTLYVNRVQAYLQLVEATVEYTRHLVSSKVLKDGGFSFAEFRIWLNANRRRYAQLIQRINATVTPLHLDSPLTESLWGFPEHYTDEWGSDQIRRAYRTVVIQER